MKCVNCDSDAIYYVTQTGVNSLAYCHKDIPVRLHDRAMRGDFAMPVVEEKPAEIIAEAPVVKKVVKKASSK